MASEKHSHNWVLDQDVVRIGKGGRHGTRYYHCSGCPLTRTENY